MSGHIPSRGRSLIVCSSISVSLLIGPALQISLAKKASVSRQDLVPPSGTEPFRVKPGVWIQETLADTKIITKSVIKKIIKSVACLNRSEQQSCFC